MSRRKEVILLKAEILKAIRDFMEEKGFVEEFYPGITNATGSCESIANIFVVKGSENFLTLRQTAQLFLEDSIVKTELPRMYTMGRSFRKDASGDGRHLQDFTLFEWEALDTDLEWSLEFNALLIEYVITHVLNISSRYGLLTKNQHRLLYRHLKGGFSKVTYTTAIEDLRHYDIKNSEGELYEWGDDLTATAEKKLTDLYGIVQVTRYPEEIKFFNMKRSVNTVYPQATVECVDLLLPKAGETIGGSQREDDYQILVDKLDTSIMLRQLTELKQEHDSKGCAARKAFDGYLKLFEGKNIVRSGAGIGLGRLLQFLTNSDKIVEF